MHWVEKIREQTKGIEVRKRTDVRRPTGKCQGPTQV